MCGVVCVGCVGCADDSLSLEPNFALIVVFWMLVDPVGIPLGASLCSASGFFPLTPPFVL